MKRLRFPLALGLVMCSLLAHAQALAAENIFVLPFPWPGTPGALRITIGSAADTDALVAAIPRGLESL